jgi:hypothetical protein
VSDACKSGRAVVRPAWELASEAEFLEAGARLLEVEAISLRRTATLLRRMAFAAAAVLASRPRRPNKATVGQP